MVNATNLILLFEDGEGVQTERVTGSKRLIPPEVKYAYFEESIPR